MSPMAAYSRTVPTLTTVKVRLRNRLGGTSGSGVRRMWRTKPAAATTATASPATTRGSAQPLGPASVSAHVPEARATAARAAPRTSMARPAWGSFVSATAATAHAIATAATGRLIRKAHRHPGPSTRTPPTKGPMAPATPPRPDQAPTAAARSDCRKLAWMIARLPGVSRAPPTPSRNLAAISVPMFGATPHSSDATANQAVPMRKTLRRPNRSPSAPPSRIRDARASR